MQKGQRRHLYYSRLLLIKRTATASLLVFCMFQCALLFAVSERISRQTKDLNQAVIMAETIVEVWKAQGEEGLVEMLLFSRDNKQEKENIVYWAALNEGWKPVDKGFFDKMELMLPHMARIEIHREGGLASAVVTMSSAASASAVAYEKKADDMPVDLGRRVVFVLKAVKYESDAGFARRKDEIDGS